MTHYIVAPVIQSQADSYDISIQLQHHFTIGEIDSVIIFVVKTHKTINQKQTANEEVSKSLRKTVD